MERKHVLIGFAGTLIVGIVIGRIFAPDKSTQQAVATPGPAQVSLSSIQAPARPAPNPETTRRNDLDPDFDLAELAEVIDVEQAKQIVSDRMKVVFSGLTDFETKFGRLPNSLEELVPEFLSEDEIVPPRFPGVPLNALGYSYEYSDRQFGDGRTFQDVKDVQREEWGDVVPILRTFARGIESVMNMSWRGDTYESTLYWEKSANTLDLAEQYGGLGSGMKTDITTEVIVTDDLGHPVSGAEVWAAGRSFSVPLPDRPFVTDSEGRATVPLGPDYANSNLEFRIVHDGVAAAPASYLGGEIEGGSVGIQVAPSALAQGLLLGDNGQPLPNTRVIVTGAPDVEGNATFIGYSETDAAGRWVADVLPEEAANASAHRRFLPVTGAVATLPQVQ